MGGIGEAVDGRDLEGGEYIPSVGARCGKAKAVLSLIDLVLRVYI